MKYMVIFLCLFGLSFAVQIHGIYKEDGQNTLENSAETSSDLEKDSKTYTFREDIYKTHNPLFSNTKQQLCLHYATMLGLSNTQTLIFNGVKLDYQYPFSYSKMQFQAFGSMTLGNVLATTQAMQNSIFFYGINAGFNASTPLHMQGVVAHAVFGMEMGAGFMESLTNNMLVRGYLGMDFLYQRYVFRPFMDVSWLLPSSNLYDVYSVGVGSIGLKTFYRGDSMLAFASLAVSAALSKNNASIFTLLPQETLFYLGANAFQLDFRGGIRYATTEHLIVHALVVVAYTANYYALSAGGQIGASYRF